jgi:malonyl-CoA decarboxylase
MQPPAHDPRADLDDVGGDPTADELDRRAVLLAQGGTDRDDGPTASTRELAALTEHLGRVMRSPALVVRRLTEQEPTPVLERLVAAEPVHPFTGPDDVADRLDEDRRCFVLEHPALPGRPLNVVWVALWRGVAQDISQVLDPSAPTLDPTSADTAVFYSIWNVEPGLVGLPGGRRLLEGAVAELRAELPQLGTFVTLSPIPGLRSWLQADGDPGRTPEGPALLRATARYLTTLRDDGRPLDAVARFHLGNGARLLSLCPGADTSERGLQRSVAMMANYRYEPEDRAANQAALRAGEVVVGDEVAALLA